MGGEFFDAAGIPAADRIARWDGAAWNAMGSDGPGRTGRSTSWSTRSRSRRPAPTSTWAGGSTTPRASRRPTTSPCGDRRSSSGAPTAASAWAAARYVGNNVYNTTGTSQSRTGSALRGHYVTFGISIQNDGTNADQFKVKATGTATTRYSVKYYRGTTDITSAVVAGTYTTTTIAKGSTFYITAKVLVKSTATVGSSVTRLVTLTSVGDAAKKDAVKLTGKRQ